MSIFILIVCYSFLFGTAYLLLENIYGLLHLESSKKLLKIETKESFQSIISGIWILIIVLLLSLLFHSLILSALFGVYLIFSGTRFLGKKLKAKSEKQFLKVIRRLLLIVLFGLLTTSGFFLINFNSEAAAEEGSPAEIKKVGGTRYVVKRGFARKGPSSRDEILGICSTGTEIKLIRKQSGYYYAKGKYNRGPQGKGKLTSGKFWIGGGLLNKDKSKRTNKKSFWHSGGKKNKSKKKKKQGKSWPNFD